MDNMLYIIAGLALILLVAALFLRKNKAQKASTPSPKVDYATPTHTNVSNSHKFDHVTIAQRFMDQQRYDKAIEAVKRGLSEKPHDSVLSLKLLSIYATINQPEDFNNVYESIKVHSDESTIVRANELKSLYLEEQNPVVAQDQELPVKNTTNFESIDFDLPTSNIDTDAMSSHSVAENTNDSVMNAPIESSVISSETSIDTEEDNFDLTLSDLENSLDTPSTTSETSVTPLDDVNNDVLEASVNDNINNSEDDDLSDFEFDSFDDNISTEASVGNNSSHSDSSQEIILEEDFVLDFDDLAADADKENLTTNDVSFNSEERSIDTIQSNEDDFALSLNSLDTSDDIDTVSNNDLSTTENDSDFDNFILENTDFENKASENVTLEEDSFADINLEEPLLHDEIEVSDVEESNIAPAASL
ncbi:MAG: tetratricopeptide repeat protein, partial [Psychrobacter sp.]